MEVSPDERGIPQCWIVEDELSFSIAADGRVEVGAYSEDGMPAKGVAMISKSQMEALALFLQGYARL